MTNYKPLLAAGLATTLLASTGSAQSRPDPTSATLPRACIGAIGQDAFEGGPVDMEITKQGMFYKVRLLPEMSRRHEGQSQWEFIIDEPRITPQTTTIGNVRVRSYEIYDPNLPRSASFERPDSIGTDPVSKSFVKADQDVKNILECYVRELHRGLYQGK